VLNDIYHAEIAQHFTFTAKVSWW